MTQKEISMTAFMEARSNGATVKELASKFDISEANCKKIIKQLGLPKRAVKPNFVLVDDRNNTPQWSNS